MSKIHTDHVFTSESVSEGHPDKVCDQISDAILDACLMQDPDSRVACETLTTTNLVVISGEITTKAKINWQEIALDAVRKIGYNDPNVGFCADEAKVMVCVHKQSPDISQGVTEGQGMFTEQGAGDQGMMFGYASNETPALMPAPIYYAHKIVEELARLRHTEPEKYRYLRPDSKSQVSIRYSQGKPVAVTAVVVSHQHTPDMEHSWLEALVKEVVRKVVPAELLNDDIVYYVNPTGRFEIGGPHGDTGLTGRKIIVDTYGGVGSHGGGAFSGKDPSKVDRSAAYMCRYIAKNIVAAGLADKCEVQVAYAIGVAEPLSINVDTYGTGKLKSDQDLEKVIRKVFSLKPAAIVKALGLKNPGKGWSYADTAAYGHFGRPQFPWEKTDKVEEIKAAAAEYLK
ncbi:methionine adenosyltransferase [Victivallaceae bacterium BBE-744-WT-12]|uniref:S-adenosylmethionine synthase n=1 Tax=Victivallis lenta TaxID=2606640 RepID=A0A844G4U6_9BACT|nr:methionine adenosyltransferase [Victivallis lenta]AVM45279.1 methionine adenosyltransferase [Victivallales bacterium CCUG 44730]MBS1451980.1 methionine adenosyltransferase [Lentisphaeria bacterium]MBS5531469.1 methionine adenosyltransferase [bacterium]MST98153.1 methionine adenosyltransferase [Victivallis lenta]HBP08160.1 methionine adenosyltransferase [Lentisphaeria bacterium]